MSELGGFICSDLVARGEKKKEGDSSSKHSAEASPLLSECPGTLCKPVLIPEIWTFMVYDAYSKVKEKYFLNCVLMTNV